MKIAIEPGRVSQEELIAFLQEKLPQYRVYKHRIAGIVVEKTGWIGARIVLRKSRILVNGDVPRTGYWMLFVVFIFLSALIAAIIYFATVYGRQKAVAKEVVAALQPFAKAS